MGLHLGSRGRHHQVLALVTVVGSRELLEQSYSWYLLLIDIGKVEAARLVQTRCAEDSLVFVVAVVAMKNAKLAVPEPESAHAEDQLIALEWSLFPADQS